MSVHGSQDFHSLPPLDRVQPVGDDRENEEGFGKGKKRASYLGRAWSEGEDELLLDLPKAQAGDEKVQTRGIYADRQLLERAKMALASYATLEEKMAELCFYLIEASYDRDKQLFMEERVRQGEVGGLIFSRGDFRRPT